MKKYYFLSALMIFSFSYAFSVHASETIDTIIDNASRGLVAVPFTDIPEVGAEVTAVDKTSLLFFTVIDFLLYIIGTAAVVMIVLSGARMVFAAGDEEQITPAKKTLLYAVLGLIVVILSLMIINTVLSMFYEGRLK
jgi:hypothetical protein